MRLWILAAGAVALAVLVTGGARLAAGLGVAVPAAPVPPPYARTPPWTWPRPDEAGTAGWLPEPWGGSSYPPEWMG